jgi:DNA repair exonuclease SbcCD ATPase subunit
MKFSGGVKMKLISIKPFYFRAFGESSQIYLNEKLTIFYGKNGTGKSSLSESIEWLFFGYTKRRRKGDVYSKNEYKGCYVNSICPHNTAPFVEAEIKLNDDSTHSIRRTMQLDKNGYPLEQESIISVDGIDKVDLSSLGVIYSEAHCPVIVQHGIQDFIHTKPIDRYRVISGALGLNDLIEFKDILEKAKNYRKNNPSLELVEAKAVITQMVKQLQSIGMTTLSSMWSSEIYSVDSDYKLIIDKAKELIGEDEIDSSTILDALQTRRSEFIKKIFDLKQYLPYSGTWEDPLKEFQEKLKMAEIQLVQAAGFYAAKVVSNYKIAHMEFLKRGMELLDSEDPQKCPFCEESTLTEERILGINNRICAEEELSKASASFSGQVNEYKDLLLQIRNSKQQFMIRNVGLSDQNSLKEYFEEGQKQVEEFVKLNQLTFQSISTLFAKVDTAIESLSSLEIAIAQPNKVIDSTEGISGASNGIRECINLVIANLNQYQKTTSKFTPVFDKRMANQSTVASISYLIELMSHQAEVQLVASSKCLDVELSEAQREVDNYILAKQKEALLSREAEILSWYSRLSPNEDVKFSGLEPGRNEFSLKAEAFGKTMNAAATLSQSQLNCLGLSIYIPCVTSTDSPFEFLLFDDPVQAMDDDHHESFILNVLPELTENSNFQVIVLTHIKETADRLRVNYINREFIYYGFDKLKGSGPVVSEIIRLKQDMKEIQELMTGNESCRELAIDRIRVLCETMMRETYLRIEGESISLPRGKGTAKHLLESFMKLPTVSASIVVGIKDTIDWSNPAHHTEPGYNVPSSDQIKPHFDRLKHIIKELNLKEE